MSFYFHSDDACLTYSSTKRVLECWERGFIDSFSVFANKELLPLVRTSLENGMNKKLRITAHLNLSDFKGSLSPEKIPMLVNTDGRFKISFFKALVIHLLGGKRKQEFLEQVYIEWNAQVQLIKNEIAPFELVAIDSHNHLHMIPSLYKVISDVAKKNEIRYVRKMNEPFYIAHLKDMFRIYFLKNLVKFIVLRLMGSFVNERDGVHSQSAVGILYSGHMFTENVKEGIKVIGKNDTQPVEFIFHVGRSRKEELTGNITRLAAVDFFIHENRDLEFNSVQQLKHE